MATLWSPTIPSNFFSLKQLLSTYLFPKQIDKDISVTNGQPERRPLQPLPFQSRCRPSHVVLSGSRLPFIIRWLLGCPRPASPRKSLPPSGAARAPDLPKEGLPAADFPLPWLRVSYSPSYGFCPRRPHVLPTESPSGNSSVHSLASKPPCWQAEFFGRWARAPLCWCAVPPRCRPQPAVSWSWAFLLVFTFSHILILRYCSPLHSHVKMKLVPVALALSELLFLFFIRFITFSFV